MDVTKVLNELLSCSGSVDQFFARLDEVKDRRSVFEALQAQVAASLKQPRFAQSLDCLIDFCSDDVDDGSESEYTPSDEEQEVSDDGAHIPNRNNTCATEERFAVSAGEYGNHLLTVRDMFYLRIGPVACDLAGACRFDLYSAVSFQAGASICAMIGPAYAGEHISKCHGYCVDYPKGVHVCSGHNFLGQANHANQNHEYCNAKLRGTTLETSRCMACNTIIRFDYRTQQTARPYFRSHDKASVADRVYLIKRNAMTSFIALMSVAYPHA